MFLLVPVHNRRATTVEFARLVAAQDYPNIRFVLIDDGSTDGTSAAVLDIVPDTEIIRGTGQWWWGGSLQQGLAAIAKECKDDDIVLFCNDDVIIDPQFVSTGVDLLKTSPKSLLLAQHREQPDAPAQETGITFDDVAVDFHVAAKAEAINCLATRGLFVSCKTAYAVGRFHTRLLRHYGSDYEWTIRAGRKGFHLWTDPSLCLTPMPRESGMRPSGQETLRNLLILYFSERSTINVPMRTMLYWFTASPGRRPKILFRYWASCFKQLCIASLRSVRLLLWTSFTSASRNE